MTKGTRSRRRAAVLTPALSRLESARGTARPAPDAPSPFPVPPRREVGRAYGERLRRPSLAGGG